MTLKLPPLKPLETPLFFDDDPPPLTMGVWAGMLRGYDPTMADALHRLTTIDEMEKMKREVPYCYLPIPKHGAHFLEEIMYKEANRRVSLRREIEAGGIFGTLPSEHTRDSR